MLPRHDTHPFQALAIVFLGWKSLLLAIAAGSRVAQSYDTSASLLAHVSLNQSKPGLVTRLTSWDAIYFVQIARRGYLFEQEWAFGSGLPTILSSLSKGFGALGWAESDLAEPMLGILVAHLAHLLSALVLYRFAIVVWRRQTLAFVAACLHIFSPAGMFLSAPCTESTFSLLSFTGYLLFAQGCRADTPAVHADAAKVAGGILFGLANTFRSNGILNGVLFAIEGCRELDRLVRSPGTAAVRGVIALGLGAVCVAAGFLVPQIVGYQIYCSGTSGVELRPWCSGWVPSIYGFVQKNYWNTGLFRYWTLSNLPLFLLAAPMASVLIKSGVDTLTGRLEKIPMEGQGARLDLMVKGMAGIQIFLAITAVTNYHVQIITRISSGYPIWYCWLSQHLLRDSRWPVGKGIVVFIIMYASIQGVLFASFLPPA